MVIEKSIQNGYLNARETTEELTIGEFQTGVRTRRQIDKGLTCFYTTVAPLQTEFSLSFFISQVEPRTYKEALTEDSWVIAMQEELS